jgi:polyribonucleotide nucleotidyltransferase
MELTPEEKELHGKTVQVLKGSERRMYMARVVQAWGRGGQARAARELGWNGHTLRKGLRELAEGPIQDNYAARGRDRIEKRLPKLREDIRAIVDGQSQTDPTFQSQRLYTRLTAREVRQQLIEQKGYTDEELPSEETIRVRINDLGYGLRPVRKSQPQKS